ncbi:MAG: hypothetical protein KGD64_08230 [Candidatus Heimdallarchaeota archaeon]|nr:hypothetical protein [Candidatus Heimdallarchaeota archaeon]
MLYLNPIKEKILTFEVELSGASSSDINGFVRFFISDQVQLGFPVVVGENEIQAVIAPLKNLVKNPVKNGTVFEAQLDLYTEDKDYFSPWKGDIEVRMPVTIEAKIADETNQGGGVRKAGVRVKSISEKSEKRKRNKEQIVEERLSKYRDIKTSNTKPIREKKKVTKDDLKKYVNEEFIYKYMNRVGTGNEKIQQIVYDQAVNAASSGNPYKVLKEVVKILGKKIPK